MVELDSHRPALGSYCRMDYDQVETRYLDYRQYAHIFKLVVEDTRLRLGLKIV